MPESSYWPDLDALSVLRRWKEGGVHIVKLSPGAGEAKGGSQEREQRRAQPLSPTDEVSQPREMLHVSCASALQISCEDILQGLPHLDAYRKGVVGSVAQS